MFIKIGLNYFSPMTFAAVRFILTAALMFVALFIKQKNIKGRNLISIPAILFGIFNGFAYALVFEGENRITSSLTAVLNAAMPFCTLILASLFVGEKVTLRKTLGLLLGFIGITFLYWRDLAQTTPSMMLGGAMIIISTVVYSIGAIIAKKYPSKGTVLEIVTTQMATSGLTLLLLVLILEPHGKMIWSIDGFSALLYLSVVGSALAFVLYYFLLKNIEVSKLSYVSMITPILAVFFGVIFLKEPFSITYLGTLAAVMAGMLIITS